MSDYTQPVKVVVKSDPLVPIIANVGEQVGIGLINTTIIAGQGDPYTGEYTITPSDAPQVLYTRGTVLDDDITVAAIPTNYGKITWNGAYLTVS